jgi:hypothetical protein
MEMIPFLRGEDRQLDHHAASWGSIFFNASP